jgi:undecaprenyl-diphosphatase
MDLLLRLSDPWAYVLVGLLAAGEGALLLGLVLPGEASMILGGVLVHEGRAGLGLMLVCAASGAVVGDSLGYWAGRRLGPRLRSGRLGRRVGEQRWQRANDYLRRRGGRAVFLGRFVGVLRALMPAIAGQANFPYPKFLAYNLPAAVLWGTGFVLLGFAAGGSWRLIDRWLGEASLVLAALALVALGTVLAARWLAGHLDVLRARRDALLVRPPVARLVARLRPQIEFARRRLDPGQQFGLYLTVGIAFTVTGAWAFGAVLEDVVARNELALFDRPVLFFLVGHHEAYLTRVMVTLGWIGSTPVVAAALCIAALWTFAATRQSRWPAFAAAAMVGALALDDLVKPLVGREPPDVGALAATGFSFPNATAAAAATLLSAVALLATRGRSWRTSVWVWSAAAFAAFTVALSRVYLATCWPTDALAGLVLGGLWTSVAATATAAWPRSSGGSGGLGWG